MKKHTLFAIALALLCSCNSGAKKAKETTKAPVEDQEVVTDIKSFTLQDYNDFLAASFNNEDSIVKAKIKAGIDVNYTEESKQTALMLASYNGHVEIVKMLIEAGANVKMKNINNRTALMLASSGPFVETVKLLLNAGAEVNAMDSHENWTPIMFAAGEGQVEVAKVLIAAGADITMVDIDGESSYDFAVTNGKVAMANYLKELAQKSN